jgi:hypothetical protein
MSDELEEKPPIPIISLKPDYENPVDLRGAPTHECVCGSNLWNVKVIFEDYQIAMYFLDMECAICGSWATAPTEVDSPDYRPDF